MQDDLSSVGEQHYRTRWAICGDEWEFTRRPVGYVGYLVGLCGDDDVGRGLGPWALSVRFGGQGGSLDLYMKAVSIVRHGKSLPFARGRFVRVKPTGLQLHAQASADALTTVYLQIGNVSGHAVMINLRECSLVASKAERVPARWSGIPVPAVGQPAWLLFGDYRVVAGVPAPLDPSQAREESDSLSSF